MGLRNWLYEKTGINLRNLTYTPHLNLNNFESFGDNCEFGLFLRKSGNNQSSFFRFTRIMNYAKVNELILNNFNDIFLLENLIPIGNQMVFDKKYEISFHLTLNSQLVSDKLEFNYTDDDFESAYQKELSKINYLSGKFLYELKTKNKIYVIKMNEQKSIQEIYNLSKVLYSLGNCKILNVRTTNITEKHYTVEQVSPGFFIGYIDQFADYDRVPEFKFNSWHKLMKNAIKTILS